MSEEAFVYHDTTRVVIPSRSNVIRSLNVVHVIVFFCATLVGSFLNYKYQNQWIDISNAVMQIAGGGIFCIAYALQLYQTVKVSRTGELSNKHAIASTTASALIEITLVGLYMKDDSALWILITNSISLFEIMLGNLMFAIYGS